MLGRRAAAPAAVEPPPAPPRPRPAAERQCTAATAAAKRCSQWTVRNSDRCHTHTTRSTRTPAALSASVASVQMDGVGWQTWRPGASAWQNEAWRLYDITGQLRYVGNWHGNSVSRCRLYVAEVDEGGEPGQEAEDPNVAGLASGPLGSGPAKDEALRLLGINLFVPGEAYIIAEAEAAEDGSDRWFVVSSRQIRRAGDRVVIRRSLLHGGGDMVFRPGVDLILRVWTPHPADTDEPDSPTRSAIPDLREIEAIRKREFAELDSRLAGAGILPLPDNIDFPRGENDPKGLQGFTQLLMRTMATSLGDRASAEAMVPIMFTVPPETLDKIHQVTFWSELSAQLLPMKESAIRSLAQSLDVPPEVLLGTADSNHWNVWALSEEAITTQIVPVLNRIADALTTGYLRAALEEIGEDPDRYVYAFDTAPLTTRPNRAADALNYHAVGLISDQAAVDAGAFRPDQMPDQEERIRRLAERAVLGAPSLLSDPTIRGLVGIEGPPPPAEGDPVPAVTPAPPPAPVRNPESPPEQTPQTEGTAALIAVAGLAMRRALSLAGGRLVPHVQRDRYTGTPRFQLHTRHGPVTADQADKALRGAWDELAASADDLGLDPDQLRGLLHGFAVELLTRGIGYDPRLLRDLIGAAMRGRRLAVMAGAA